MSIAVQAVTMRAEGITILIITAQQASFGLIVTVKMEQADRALGFQNIVNVVGQDTVVAFSGVAQDFANHELRVTSAQVFEPRHRAEMVVDVGRGEGASDRRQSSTILKALDL